MEHESPQHLRRSDYNNTVRTHSDMERISKGAFGIFCPGVVLQWFDAYVNLVCKLDASNSLSEQGSLNKTGCDRIMTVRYERWLRNVIADTIKGFNVSNPYMEDCHICAGINSVYDMNQQQGERLFDGFGGSGYCHRTMVDSNMEMTVTNMTFSENVTMSGMEDRRLF